MILPLLATSAFAQSVLDSISTEVRGVYDKTKDSIARVKAEPSSAGRTRIGSGFFIDESGKLLTTATVVTNAKRIWIEWQDHQLPMKLVGTDAHANVALLQVEGEEAKLHKFPALPLGDSRSLQVGTAVIAMGNPYDLPASPSFGIVGGFDLHQLTKVFVTSHIRADIALSPGESGGPLLNSRGEVVGILVASAEQSPACYALPVHALKRLVVDFEQFGEAHYGWMGMGVLECNASQQKHPEHISCIKVQQVFSNAPAWRAGIQDGDMILKVGDTPVQRLADMLDISFAARVGEKLDVQVRRQAMLTNFLVEVAERPLELPSVKATPASKTE